MVDESPQQAIARLQQINAQFEQAVAQLQKMNVQYAETLAALHDTGQPEAIVRGLASLQTPSRDVLPPRRDVQPHEITRMATPEPLPFEDLHLPAQLYLDLLKKVLTRYIFNEQNSKGEGEALDARQLHRQQRAAGKRSPIKAETMIGLTRLDNIELCVTDALRRKVPGDLIETGVWRGGATIFMRALLKVNGDTERLVWAADSFQGVPEPDPEQFPADAGATYHLRKGLAVSVEDVKANFARYGLLDDQVRFLVGWFRDTLPDAPIERLAVLRLDGDLYESTMVALQSLYPRVSIGGYVIIDDYGLIPMCKQAVDDFRAEHNITETINKVDYTCVYWQRTN